MVVVKLKKGISKEERERMKSGEIEDPSSGPYYSAFGGADYCKRSSVVRAEDEDGNNLRPYNWEEFGLDSFFGQTITHWCELPMPPIEYIMGRHKHEPIMDKIKKMANKMGIRHADGVG
jgi:hypothetical protein